MVQLHSTCSFGVEGHLQRGSEGEAGSRGSEYWLVLEQHSIGLNGGGEKVRNCASDEGSMRLPKPIASFSSLCDWQQQNFESGQQVSDPTSCSQTELALIGHHAWTDGCSWLQQLPV